MFKATLFIIFKTWKQPKCPSIDNWVKKMCVCVCVCVCALFSHKRMKYCLFQQHEWPYGILYLVK